MKILLNRDLLLEGLSNTQGVVERKGINPILSNVHISLIPGKVQLLTSDVEVELRSEFDCESDLTRTFTLSAKKLLEICKSLPSGSDVLLNISDAKVIVSSARARFSLASLPGDEYPIIPFEASDANTIALPAKTLQKSIEKIFFSMAQQDVRYYLNGLFFDVSPEGVLSVATDGHRLSLCKQELQINTSLNKQVIVPRKGAQEILRLANASANELSVSFIKNHLSVSNGLQSVTSKLIDGQYPDYKKVVPVGMDKTVTVNRESLKQSLSRASILSNEKFKGIRLHLTENSLEVLTHNPEQEEAKDEIDIDYQGPELNIGFNVVYLLDVLNIIKDEEVEVKLKDENCSCLISGANDRECEYIVMPMRL